MEENLDRVDSWVPTPEELDQMFSGMSDSVRFINEKIAAGGPFNPSNQAQYNEDIRRNAMHLDTMLTLPYIVSAGRPLTPYQTAITDGMSYIASHSVKD